MGTIFTDDSWNTLAHEVGIEQTEHLSLDFIAASTVPHAIRGKPVIRRIGMYLHGLR